MSSTPHSPFFSVNVFFEYQWPCDSPQLWQLRKLLAEECVKDSLTCTLEAEVTFKLITMKELIRVIVSSTVQVKAVALFFGSKLLEIAKSKVV